MARYLFKAWTAFGLLAVCPTPTVLACDLHSEFGPKRFGAGAHGGERMQSDFLQGLRQAAYVVSTVRTSTLARATDNNELRAWIIDNKDALKETLDQAQIEFNDDANQLFCALVRDNQPHLINVSRARCHNITSTPKAGELLIHEAVHLMGIASETFAPAVADALYRAWEFAGHTLDNSLHSTTAEQTIPGRYQHTGVWTGKHAIFWGGLTSDGETRTGGIYDHVLDRWEPTAVRYAPAARYGHTAVWSGSEMIVWGGARTNNLRSDRVGEHYRTGGRLDPATNSWRTINYTHAPSERYRHTAVWTGNAMIVWGGTRQDNPLMPNPNYQYLNSGGIYDPLQDSWRATPLEHAPAMRFDHTATWAGGDTQKMLIWGGYAQTPEGQSHIANTGAMYDPVANQWFPMSTERAPSPRVRHSAVWTGSKLIIWGGYGYENGSYKPLNSGGMFDPATNTWEVFLTDNAPVARDGHVAVWTGSHMLIYGGRNPVAVEPEERSAAPDPYTTIALYNPETKEWQTPLFGDVWMDRRHAVGLWTGHEFITWGGDNYRKSGRVYYPQ